ncbi:MAG: lipoprotein [Oceanicaulis sp. HLUCCA04]|nr:MAG: lipoprotein [Oceanicaulis sp. HLUCCA04]
MAIRLTLLAALSCIAIAACSPTQTTYGPAIGPVGQAVGFDSLRITDNRWRVSFTAGPDLSVADAERLAMRRAAEIVLENGFAGFEIVSRRIDTTRGRSPVQVGGSAGTSAGSGGFRASGVGLGVSFSPGQESRTAVSLEIFARPAPLAEDPAIYDARSLIAPTG